MIKFAYYSEDKETDDRIVVVRTDNPQLAVIIKDFEKFLRAVGYSVDKLEVVREERV